MPSGCFLACLRFLFSFAVITGFFFSSLVLCHALVMIVLLVNLAIHIQRGNRTQGVSNRGGEPVWCFPEYWGKPNPRSRFHSGFHSMAWWGFCSGKAMIGLYPSRVRTACCMMGWQVVSAQADVEFQQECMAETGQEKYSGRFTPVILGMQ